MSERRIGVSAVVVTVEIRSFAVEWDENAWRRVEMGPSKVAPNPGLRFEQDTGFGGDEYMTEGHDCAVVGEMLLRRAFHLNAADPTLDAVDTLARMRPGSLRDGSGPGGEAART